MTTDTKLLPLPELPVAVERFILSSLGPVKREGAVTELRTMLREYARANVSHATAAKDAEIEALREQLDWAVKENDRLLAEGSELTTRAKRLEEALREMREYITAALQAEREAFAGHEDSSDIPGIEADLHKIDALLREERRNKAARTDSTTYKEETND